MSKTDLSLYRIFAIFMYQYDTVGLISMTFVIAILLT